MAKYSNSGRGGDGSDCPSESVELDGKIVTAAQSTMADANYERGYPAPKGALHMSQPGSRK
jgi:hypothetical protein